MIMIMNERFLRAEMLLGAGAMEKLKSSHVAVFGLGGVGSWCAEALARSGVGRITLIDRDTVGRSNINRQLCALESTLGLGKAEVMKARLCDINPDISVTALTGHYDAAHREDFFADYDFIVDCIDLVACKVDLIRTAKERGIPIVSALGTGNKCDAERLTLCDIKKDQRLSAGQSSKKGASRRGDRAPRRRVFSGGGNGGRAARGTAARPPQRPGLAHMGARFGRHAALSARRHEAHSSMTCGLTAGS